MVQSHENLFKSLKNLGLSDHEATVYLASLSLGPTTVIKIARAADIKRTTAYYVIEDLKRQGFMNIEVRGLKHLYVAEDPRKLASLIDKRRDDFRQQLPELSALYNLKGGESLIKYYEGLAAVKNVYEDTLETIRVHEDFLVISDTERWSQLDSNFFLDWRKRRSKKNINRRLLLQDTKTAQEYQKFQNNYGEQIKLLPSDTKLITNMMITPQRVVIHQLTPPIMAIVIENKSIIQMHQQLFEIIWKTSDVHDDRK